MSTLADLQLRQLLDVFATATPSPGGGSVAALAAANAAALVERCATASPGPEFARARARARALRDELLALADRDASVLASLAASHGAERKAAAFDASGPPALMRVAAEEIAGLAAALEHHGAIAYRGEASCARVLATAAASMAQAIVELNCTIRPAGASTSPDAAPSPVVDLDLPSRGRGPQWGMQSIELNATLLAWPAGAGVAEHRNSERDVLVVVLDGSATLTLEGVEHEIGAHELVLLPRDATRALRAGDGGVRYLSIHLRRAPLVPRSR